MAVKIRLKRMGKTRQPYYRVVVVDGRKKRDGRVIEEIGKYHPKEEPSFIEVKSERVQHWLGVGAQPSEAVEVILKVTGDWQKFKGLPGAEGTLRTRAPRRDKTEIFNEALKDAAREPKSGAVTPKQAEKPAEKPAGKAAGKAAEKPAPQVADEPAEAAPAPAEKAEPAKEAAPAAGPYGDDSAAPLADGSGPEGFEVKGNEDSKKFHAPSSPWYGRTVAEVWFRSVEAAEKAGFVNAEKPRDGAADGADPEAAADDKAEA